MAMLQTLSVAVIALHLFLGVTAAVTVRVSAFYPLQGEEAGQGIQYRKAVELAVGQVNADASVLPGITLTLGSENTNSSASAAATEAYEAIVNEQAVALIGAESSDTSEAMGYLCNIFQVPQVSYASTSTTLSNEDTFPYFARTVAADDLQAQALAAFVEFLGWQHIAIIHADTDYATSLVTAFSLVAARYGITVGVTTTHKSIVGLTTDAQRQAAKESMRTALQDVLDGRVRLVLMSNVDADARALLAEAHAMDMVGPSRGLNAEVENGTVTMWLGTDGWFSNDLFEVDDNCDSACVANLREITKGMLGAAPSRAAFGAAFTTWESNVWNPAVSTLTAEEQALSSKSNWKGDNMSPWVPFARDALWVVARALHAVCPGDSGAAASTCPAKWAVGKDVFAAIKALNFTGITGQVAFEADGDRRSSLDLVNLNSGGSFVTQAVWHALTGQVENVTVNGAVYWPGGLGEPKDIAGLRCKAGETRKSSVDGYEFCTLCPSDTYGVDGISCLACPEGANCPGGAVVTLQKGWWVDMVTTGTAIEPYYCRPNPDLCCPCGDCPLLPVATRILNATCEANREGVLCGTCADGYSEYKHKCIPCDHGSPLSLLGLILAGLITVILLIRAKPTKNAVSRLVVDYLQLVSLIMTPRPGEKNGLEEILDSNILNLQLTNVFGGVGTSGSAAQTDCAAATVGATTGSSQDLEGSGCLLPLSPLGGVAFSYFMPAVLITELLFILLIVRPLLPKCFPRGLPNPAKCCKRKKKKSSDSDSDDDHVTNNPAVTMDVAAEEWGVVAAAPAKAAPPKPKIAAPPPKPLHMPRATVYMAAWRMLFLVYNNITLTGLRLVNCRTVGDVRVLENSPAVECGTTGQVFATSIGVALLLVFTVATPVNVVLVYRKFVVDAKKAAAKRAEQAALIERRNIEDGRHLPHREAAAVRQRKGAGRGAGAGAGAAGDKDGEDDGTRIISASAVFGVAPSADDIKHAAERSKAGSVFLEMYQLYREPVRGWFEAAYYTRRTIAVSVLVFLSFDLIWRQVALFVLSVVLLFFHLGFMPFASDEDNRLGALLSGSMCVIAGLEVYAVNVFVLDANKPHVTSGRAVFVSVIDLILILWPILYLARYRIMGVINIIRASIAAKRAKRKAAYEARQRARRGGDKGGDSMETELVSAEQTAEMREKAMAALGQELGYRGRVALQEAVAQTAAAAAAAAAGGGKKGGKGKKKKAKKKTKR